MTQDEVRALLDRACEEAGSKRAWARKHRVAAPYVSDVLKGKRDPGPAILKPLGLEKVDPGPPTYRRAT